LDSAVRAYCEVLIRDHVRDADEADPRTQLQKAIGSFRWLENNAHNIKLDPLRFERFFRAALEDLDRGTSTESLAVELERRLDCSHGCITTLIKEHV
jgi:hypothetical protein